MYYNEQGIYMLVGAPYDVTSNVSPELKQEYAAINLKRLVERFHTRDVREGTVIIVGGGPSLADTVDAIAHHKSRGAKVWATNNSYAYLVKHGIQPDAQVILDSRPENAAFLHPHPDVIYYLNVSCHPSLFDKLEKCEVIMYDLSSAATGFSVGIKALYLAAFSGYRDFKLYGMDSSYRDDDHHAYAQTLNDGENVVDVIVDGRKFRAAPWMAIQAGEFQQVAESLAEQGCTISVAGDGLLPWIANRMMHTPNILTAVYDLTVSPPTYDFATFLSEAERRRIETGAEAIDLMIQPGPLGGFRNDDLPPNLGARVGMLYRVVVAMARLLPSVRNIEVLKARKNLTGDNIFPVGYTVNMPIAQYGQDYARHAQPILFASEAAKLHVSKAHPGRYITITTRESTHWPARNSNMAAWSLTANYLKDRGYKVVWVPDAESVDANLYSFDLDMRLALYEGAIVNLGINNGPMMILPFTSCRYVAFKMVTEGIPWTERAFFDKWGTKEGIQPGGRGKFIFAEDSFSNITKELDEYLKIAEAA